MSPDPWNDYWWPKVLRECEEYRTTVQRRRQQRIKASIYIASFGAFGLICLAAFNAELSSGVFSLFWQQMTEPPTTYSTVEMPFT